MARDIVNALRGSARVSEESGAPDPSLKILVERMSQLESTVRLQQAATGALEEANDQQKAYIADLIKDKERAEQALTASQERLQALREEAPVSPEDRLTLIKGIQEEAGQVMKKKAALFREVLQKAPMVEVFNPGPPITLTVNRITVMLQTGRNQVPEPFALAWEDSLTSDQEAMQRDKALQGGAHNLNYGAVESWLASGKSLPDPIILPVSGPGTTPGSLEWDEEAGRFL